MDTLFMDSLDSTMAAINNQNEQRFIPAAADKRWQQVLNRDAAAEGRFVYAVRSTGIYCRTTCASRRPKRENVEFFATPIAARNAGYRACERCKPDAPAKEVELVKRACALMAKDDLPRRELVAELGTTAAILSRSFNRVLGISVKEYAAARRLKRFRNTLNTQPQAKVTDALYEAGFNSSSRLYESAGTKLGMTPTQYKRGGAGQEVRYTTAASSLGKMLVASTGKGICAILFGDNEAELSAELKTRFAKADLHRDEKNLAAEVRAVLEHLREPHQAFALPLDLRATAYESRVWQALRNIPAGETRTYSAVAAALGQPTAVRAVAQACGRNPVAVVVPCHRVIGSNGKLTGYRWGLARKKKLLEIESRGGTPLTFLP
jgi:AraC family transcriptional regulator of adaptative response/methylated-DNA-[protein]-cysteine methyltransferase